MKCLIIDVVSPAIAEELGKYMEVDTKILPTQEELAGMIGDYEVLIMRVDPAVNKTILNAAKKLKVIGVCSVGLNHIDMDTAKANGVQVFNAPGLNSNAVAELTITKMLEMSRHTIPACIDVKINRNWDKYKYMARGGIVNEEDMYEALKSGKIGGYASDVMEEELVDEGLDTKFHSPLIECDNFIISPHLGAQTVDAARDIGDYIINRVKEALDLK